MRGGSGTGHQRDRVVGTQGVAGRKRQAQRLQYFGLYGCDIGLGSGDAQLRGDQRGQRVDHGRPGRRGQDHCIGQPGRGIKSQYGARAVLDRGGDQLAGSGQVGKLATAIADGKSFCCELAVPARVDECLSRVVDAIVVGICELLVVPYLVVVGVRKNKCVLDVAIGHYAGCQRDGRGRGPGRGRRALASSTRCRGGTECGAQAGEHAHSSRATGRRWWRRRRWRYVAQFTAEAAREGNPSRKSLGQRRVTGCHLHQCTLTAVRIQQRRAVGKHRAGMAVRWRVTRQCDVTGRRPALDKVVFQSDLGAVQKLQLQVIAQLLDDDVVQELFFLTLGLDDAVTIARLCLERMQLTRLEL